MPWGVAAAAVVGAVASNVASNKAGAASDRASDTASTITREGIAQSRSDLLNLFPSAQQVANQGFQNAANVFSDVVPQQSQIFQQGNINAQNTLLSGLPQQQNAILGGNVNLGALQPTTQFQPNFGFLNNAAGLIGQNQGFDAQGAGSQGLQNLFGSTSPGSLFNFRGVGPGEIEQPFHTRER